MIPMKAVVAIDEQKGIGKEGELPWHLTGDLKNFQNITCSTQSPKKKNIVLMGRKTWQSIPKQFQPLHDRINVVLTQNPTLDVPYGVLKAESFQKVDEMLHSDQLKSMIESVYVIGGQAVYEEALKRKECERLYITRVHGKFQCDAFFPDFENEYEKQSESNPHNEGPITYHFEEYARKG